MELRGYVPNLISLLKERGEEMGEKRSVRSDKKYDVRLSVHTEFKEAIYRLSFITNVSVMDTVEAMLVFAIRSKRILNELSTSFVRDIKIDNILYIGHENAERYGPTPTKNINYVRIKTRLKQNDYHVLTTIAYALDVRPARACAILINEAFHSPYFLDNYIKQYLQKNITDHQLLELKKIMEYANREENLNINWATLLSFIIREVQEPVTTIKEKVNSFVIKHWKDK